MYKMFLIEILEKKLCNEYYVINRNLHKLEGFIHRGFCVVLIDFDQGILIRRILSFIFNK